MSLNPDAVLPTLRLVADAETAAEQAASAGTAALIRSA
jgi:hypothetical protein